LHSARYGDEGEDAQNMDARTQIASEDVMMKSSMHGTQTRQKKSGHVEMKNAKSKEIRCVIFGIRTN
jgi:hypothetical protein